MSAVVKAVKSVVSAVGSVVSKAADVVSDVVSSAGDFVSSAVETVSHAVESVADTVVHTVENVIKDPIPTLVSLAGQAVGIPAPLTMAALTAARGGSLEDIALSAGTAYYAPKAVSFISAEMSPYIKQALENPDAAKVVTDSTSKALVSGTLAEARGGDFNKAFNMSFTGNLAGGTASIAYNKFAAPEVMDTAKNLGLDEKQAKYATNVLGSGIANAASAEALGKDASQAFEGSISNKLAGDIVNTGAESVLPDGTKVNIDVSAPKPQPTGAIPPMQPRMLQPSQAQPGQQQTQQIQQTQQNAPAVDTSYEAYLRSTGQTTQASPTAPNWNPITGKPLAINESIPTQQSSLGTIDPSLTQVVNQPVARRDINELIPLSTTMGSPLNAPVAGLTALSDRSQMPFGDSSMTAFDPYAGLTEEEKKKKMEEERLLSASAPLSPLGWLSTI